MKIPVTITTLNAETGEKISTKATHVDVLVKPVPEDVCQQCGRQHPPEAPHDAQSLRYLYQFYAEHNRWPTWADAMAHCPPHVQMIWTDVLAQRGIDVHGGAHE